MADNLLSDKSLIEAYNQGFVPKKKKVTGLGKSGTGKVLKKKKGESIKSLAKRQGKEFGVME